MKRAILFLLVICSLAGIALAQVENNTPDAPSQEQVPSAEQPPQNNEPATNEGQVEKDPDELGADSPFQVEQPASKYQNPPINSPEPENNTTVKTDDSEENHVNSAKDPHNFMDTVQLQGLNKITARTSKLEVKVGDSIKFGNLKITLHACWKSPQEEETENKALLEMWEEIPGEPRTKVFSGWMFSSSPLISAPEHPIYDITVLACSGNVVGTAPKKEVEKPAENTESDPAKKPSEKPAVKPSKKKR